MNRMNQALSSVTNWWNDEKQLAFLKRTKIVNDNFINHLNKAIEIVEKTYPEKWDVQLFASEYALKYENNNRFGTGIRIIIHFPRIRISNSKKLFHQIHDLYVAFKVTNNGRFEISMLEGLRETYSTTEYQYNYAHSHLPSILFTSSPDYKGFCTGTGAIVQVMMMFNAEIMDGTFNEELFKMFLFEIKMFTEWESIEGGPYLQIDSLRAISENGNLHPVDSHTKERSIQDFKEYLHKSIIKIENINITTDKNKMLLVVDDDRFNDFLVSAFGTAHMHKGVYCGRNENGEYVPYSLYPSSEVRPRISKLPFYFKGKRKVYNVDFSIPSNSPKKFIYPELRKFFKKMLEYELNKRQIKNYAFR